MVARPFPVTVGTAALFLTLAHFGATASTCTPAGAELASLQKKKGWESDPLLPKDVRPNHYNLFLDPRIDEGIFHGQCTINVEITAPRDYLVLNTKFLNITSTQLSDSNLTSVPIKSAFEYQPNEFWIVQLCQTAQPGNYSIKLEFSGSLTNGIVGFYRSTYTAKDGTQRHIVTTKFEPTYARRAFPCFDEPAYKATFSTKLVRPASGGYFALSNMNQIEEEIDFPTKGRVTVKFARTPLMSTYLACFIVCDFAKLEVSRSQSSDTDVTVYLRDGQQSRGEMARSLAPQVLDYFSEYFDIDYPLPKLDLIAVPDFVSGAMENWGLVTFREIALLVRRDESAAHDLSRTAGTVAHELAHMWFGDLVTMSWWDDLWLNEGFATFLATYVLHKLHPELQSQSRFVSREMSLALAEDAAVSSHPIIQEVKRPDQITEMFDAISYNKGSSVLRMIENIDPEGFRKAVSRYLKSHKYKNARTPDLWAELVTEFKGIDDLPRLLDTWTKQMGYPLVNVKRLGNSLIFEQSRFLTNPDEAFDKDSSKFKYKWDIPIQFRTSNNLDQPASFVLKLDQKNGRVDLPEGVSWFKINTNYVGFYRVNYTEDEWLNLKTTLESNVEVLSPEDRAGLLDDAFTLANSGYTHYWVPLKLMGYLASGKDRHWLPWSTLYRHINRLLIPLAGSPSALENLKAYCAKIVLPVLTDDVWVIKNEDSLSERMFKDAVTELACKVGVPSALSKATGLFSKWMQGGPQVPVDLRSTVYKYGIRGENDESLWAELWDRYLVEENPQEKDVIADALAGTNNSRLIEKLLKYMEDEKYVRSQDYFILLGSLYSSPEGNAIVWDFVRSNWNHLVERFTLNHRMFGRVLPGMSRLFFTEERLEQLNQLIAKHPEAGAGANGRKQAVERTKWNVLWVQKYLSSIETELKRLTGT